MGERMTSAEARAHAMGFMTGPWSRAADALEHYECEDAARAGMPELRCPWRVVDREGEEWRQGYTKEVMLREDHLTKLAASYPKDAPFRLVRLAVVEVAEPPRPVREQGVSGWWYERTEVDGKPWVLVWDADEGDKVAEECSSRGIYIPPADRALVARLLGEGVGDA